MAGYLILFLAVIALDQLTKLLIHANMFYGESIAVIPDVFHITYVRNTGAAFSILNEHTLFLGIFAALLVVSIMVYVFVKNLKVHNAKAAERPKKADKLIMISLTVIAAGGTGNVADRLFRGYVVDFFDFRIFPVFNVADIFVTFGCILLIIAVIFSDSDKSSTKNSQNR